jgi:hypothetical protein
MVPQVPGVARLVSFGDKPAPVSDAEIEVLRSGLQGQIQVQPDPYLSEGHKVRIMRGSLAGMEGILLRRKGNLRLVPSLALIMCSVAVDATDIFPIDGSIYGNRQSQGAS